MSSKIRFRTSGREGGHARTPRPRSIRLRAQLREVQHTELLATIGRYIGLVIR